MRIILNVVPLAVFFGVYGCKDDVEPDLTSNEDTSGNNPGIYINEVVSKTAAADTDWDWIELYNATDADVDISGYILYDKLEDAFTIPQGTVLKAKGYVVFEQRKPAEAGFFVFGLSSDADKVYLRNNTGTVIDNVSFSTMSDGESYGRLTDGAAQFVYFSVRSKGTTNNGNSQR